MLPLAYNALTPFQPSFQSPNCSKGHEHPVTSFAVQPLGGGSFLLAATSGGPDVIVWACRPAAEAAAAQGPPDAAGALSAAFGPAAWELQQRLAVGAQTQLCAALAPLPGAPGWLLLATGGADNAVRLHVRPPGGSFALQCKLTGHENWVRSVALASAREAPAGGGEEGGEEVLLLASASQDRCVSPVCERLRAHVIACAGTAAAAAVP